MTGADDSPTLWALFLACGKISVSSFGGGVSAIMMVDFVTKRRWIGEADFIDSLSISQALPGVNVVNLSLWIGYRLRGSAGAIVACLGAVVPAAFIIIAAGVILHQVAHYPIPGLILTGLGIAALGLSFNIVFRTMRRAMVNAAISLPIFGATIAAAAFHAPTYLTVIILAPLSIGLCYWKLKRG